MTRDMTTGSPASRILGFCVPLLIGNLFQQFYNLVDSYIVGQYLGVDAFAAVGSTGSLSFLVLGFALGICSGFSIPIAQSFGARDFDTLRKRVGQTVWLGIGFSVLITLLAYFLTAPILRLIKTPDELFDDAYRYIFVILMGAATSILYNLVSGILRALGDSRTPLLFLIGACLVNIVLDVAFIAWLGMGVEGAAYATLIAQTLSGVLCIFYIRARVPQLALTHEDLKPDVEQMRYLVSSGVPMGLQFSITAVGTIVIQSAVNSLGANAVAAVCAGNKVNLVMSAPLETLGVGMATYCGQNLGAGRVDRIRAGIRSITLCSMVWCAAIGVLNFTLNPRLALLFIEDSNPEIFALISQFLAYLGVCYPLLALIFIFRNSLQGLGFSNSAMLAGVAELVARSTVAFGFVGTFGYNAVCFAHPLAWLFADLILLPLYAVKMRSLLKSGGAALEQKNAAV